ncbi:unnamed protein product [Pleuronectes platessa]|uniref:Uncharacterized protein n=1 Tax=Pleuronectes platessa TaxID=8262 RepID=A0A9N7ZC66_PLEPL|nr:unnamed protein product [Pleuronectes platessa]
MGCDVDVAIIGPGSVPRGRVARADPWVNCRGSSPCPALPCRAVPCRAVPRRAVDAAASAVTHPKEPVGHMLALPTPGVTSHSNFSFTSKLC